MINIVPIVLFVTTMAFSPGPNNLLVLRAATQSKALALQAIAIIVTMALSMLAVASTVLAQAQSPWLKEGLSIASALIMLWLALTCWLNAGKVRLTEPSTSGALALAGLQLANPKGWIMVTALASLGVKAGLTLSGMALILAILTASGLASWALLGAILARFLTAPSAHKRVDQGSAVALAVSALSFLALDLNQ